MNFNLADEFFMFALCCLIFAITVAVSDFAQYDLSDF